MSGAIDEVLVQDRIEEKEFALSGRGEERIAGLTVTPADGVGLQVPINVSAVLLPCGEARSEPSLTSAFSSEATRAGVLQSLASWTRK